MIRHLVLLRFKEQVSEQTRNQLIQNLGKLRYQLNGILDFQYSNNISVEEPLVRGFTKLFWFEFINKEHRDNYLKDEEHKKLGALLVEHLEGGLDGVFTCDIDL